MKRNQFDGTQAGRLRKSKLFFFAGYQGTLVRQTPISIVAYVPTPDMFHGDFTTFASAVCQSGHPSRYEGGL